MAQASRSFPMRNSILTAILLLTLLGCIAMPDQAPPALAMSPQKEILFTRCWRAAAEGHERERKGGLPSLNFYYGLHRDALRKQCIAFAEGPGGSTWPKLRKNYPAISAAASFQKSCVDATNMARHHKYNQVHYQDVLQLCALMASELES